jgi:hypothetical protein
MEPFIDKKENRRRKKRFLRRVLFLSVCLFIGVVGGGVYLVVFSPFAEITAIDVRGTDQISKDEIINTLTDIVSKKPFSAWMGKENIFLWHSGDVEIGYTAAQTVHVARNMVTRSVTITVEPREYYGVLCLASGECAWFDHTGFLFDEAPDVEGQFIVKIIDRERDRVLPGDRVVDGALMENMKRSIEMMQEIDMPATHIELSRTFQEIRWRTFEGADILLSMRFDPSVSIQALQKFTEKISLANVEYVDLRVEGRLYYKPF